MNNYKLLLAVIALSLNLGLISCAQPDRIEDDQVHSIEAHPSKLVGSLVKSELNSPELFIKDVINERTNFKVDTQTEGHETDQLISNADGSFNSVVFWEESDQGLIAKGMIVSISQPMTPDNVQVLKRMALRLNDSNTVENAINQNVKFTALSNGAGITIKDVDGRKQYEIY